MKQSYMKLITGQEQTINYRVDDAGGQFHFENRDVTGRVHGCYGQVAILKPYLHPQFQKAKLFYNTKIIL